MARAIPRQMRALVLDRYGEDVVGGICGLKLADRPVPTPGHGQVLVRIEAAACNPSDLLLLQGKYGALKTLPTVPGWEGAGHVVAHGGGWLARWLQGRRVACAIQGDCDGTWAQYACANADECIPVRPEVPLEQAAGLIINPLTALGLLDRARRGGHRAAVHTAAASQLGRMLVALTRDRPFPIVHVVRRHDQVELLRSLGATHVLDASAPGFLDAFRTTCRQLQATVAFEAVAGDLTGLLLQHLPPGATVYVYGALSQQACGQIDPIDLILRDKTVAGFFLGTWRREQSSLRMLRLARRVQHLLLDGTIETVIRRRLPLDQAVEGLQQYVARMTDGKVLICL